MSGTLFKEVSYSLNKIITDIEMGEIGLPDIQRPFVWKNVKVRDLFDSMYRGFPVGYLLFWANGFPGEHRQIGTEMKQSVPRLLIVDGQQRLTSLYAVLKGKPILRENFKSEHLNIAFCPKEETFAVADAATRRDPEFIADISQLWAGAMTRNRFVKSFLKRLRESREVSEDEEDRLIEAIDRVYDLQNYPFTALELSSTVEEEGVAEVFVRINSQGTTLNQGDFILTLMSVFWDEGRAQLEEFCRASRQPSAGVPSPYNHYIEPDPDHLLRVSTALGFHRARLKHVYSILRGKDLQTGEFSDERRVRQFEVLKSSQADTLDLQNWHEFFKVLLRAGFRGSSMISSRIGLLYCYAFYLIGKRQFSVDSHALRDVMARWFFMTQLTGRYTQSPEGVAEEDLARLSDISDASEFMATLDGIVADTFTNDYWEIALPNQLTSAAPRSPGLFAYYAALNLLEARVLFSKLKVADLFDPASKAKKAALEKHHLFPRAYLKNIGIKRTRQINQIANFALVEWSDNIIISDQSPSEYFPIHAARFSGSEMQKLCYWHALPEDWTSSDYFDFLSQRRKLMAGVIRDAYDLIKAPSHSGVSADNDRIHLRSTFIDE